MYQPYKGDVEMSLLACARSPSSRYTTQPQEHRFCSPGELARARIQKFTHQFWQFILKCHLTVATERVGLRGGPLAEHVSLSAEE